MNLMDRLIVLSLPWAPKPLVKQFAKRYVAGESMEEMLHVVRELNQQGILCTIDVLGEFIHQKSEAQQAAEMYKKILVAVHQEQLSANVSVKLSQMGLLLDQDFCYEIMRDLVETAQRYGNFILIDMEDSACTTDTIQLYLKLRKEFSNVGIVLQAYLRRTLKDAQEIMAAGVGHFRLCKGIYIEPRTLAFKDKELINKNYIRVLDEMFQHGAYAGIATHDEKLVWEAERLIEKHQLQREQYEFQMLLGVDQELREIIQNAGHRVRVYVPFGQHWHAYCMRRLKENPTIARFILKNLFQSLKAKLAVPQSTKPIKFKSLHPS